MGTGSLALDINGDGRLELLSSGIFGTSWQAIGYNANSGGYEIVHSARLPFPFTQFDGGTGPISMGTLSAGGPQKLFLNSPSFQVFDLASLKLETIADTSFGGGKLYSVDLNSDGKTELVGQGGTVVDGNLTTFLDTDLLDGDFVGHFDSKTANQQLSASGALFQWNGSGWTQKSDLGIVSGVTMVSATADLTGDGLDDYIYSTNGAELQVYDFSQSKTLWHVTTTSVGGHSSNYIRGIAIADANGDGLPDVLVVTNGAPNDPGEVRAYDGRTGAELWSFQHPDNEANNIFVGKFDDSAGMQIMFGTFRPVTGPARIWVYDLATRQEKWHSRQEIGPVRAMAIADLTPDAGNEVIVAPAFTVGDGDTILHVRDLASMAWLKDLPSAKLPVPTADGVQALALGDVMGDSAQELVVGADDVNGVSTVYVYSWPDQTLLQSFSLDPGTVVVDLAIGDLTGSGQQQIVAATGWKDTAATGT
jgi:hypothetical protein